MLPNWQNVVQHTQALNCEKLAMQGRKSTNQKPSAQLRGAKNEPSWDANEPVTQPMTGLPNCSLKRSL